MPNDSLATYRNPPARMTPDEFLWVHYPRFADRFIITSTHTEGLTKYMVIDSRSCFQRVRQHVRTFKSEEKAIQCARKLNSPASLREREALDLRLARCGYIHRLRHGVCEHSEYHAKLYGGWKPQPQIITKAWRCYYDLKDAIAKFLDRAICLPGPRIIPFLDGD